MIELTDKNFEAEVIQSQLPILVDYWAPWCGPCQQIAPILEDLAQEYEGKVLIGKINVDENSETPQKYGVRGIPTLMLFKNGQVEETRVGLLSKSQIISLLDSHIAVD